MNKGEQYLARLSLLAPRHTIHAHCLFLDQFSFPYRPGKEKRNRNFWFGFRGPLFIYRHIVASSDKAGFSDDSCELTGCRARQGSLTNYW
jgi:hypothetical protein